MSDKSNDIRWMKEAIRQAELSAIRGEVPVGAALVKDDKLVASAGNCPISRHDPVAHAEIIVLRKGAKKMRNYRLPGTVLYVTLEPCVMCAGAILHARISRVVFGVAEPKTGALISKYQIGSDGLLQHRLIIDDGILAKRCRRLLTEFFRERRKKKE